MGDRSLLRFRFWASLCDLTCDLTCSRFVFCSPARCLFSVRPRGVCLVGLRAVCFAVSMQGVVLCDTVGGLEFSRLDIDPPGDRY